MDEDEAGVPPEAHVRAVHVLAPDADPGSGGLPRLGAVLAAGEVSREHTRVAVGAAGRVPRKLLREGVTAEDAAGLGLGEEGTDAQARPVREVREVREVRCRGEWSIT